MIYICRYGGIHHGDKAKVQRWQMITRSGFMAFGLVTRIRFGELPYMHTHAFGWRLVVVSPLAWWRYLRTPPNEVMSKLDSAEYARAFKRLAES